MPPEKGATCFVNLAIKNAKIIKSNSTVDTDFLPMAVVVLEIATLVLQRVERFIFDPPPSMLY